MEKKFGIFYGSTTGITETVANQIGEKLGISATDIHNVSGSSASDVQNYDCLLFGSSTWGDGEVQDDWYDFIKDLEKENLNGKKVGIFGCGDSASYPDTFCDAVGLIYQALQPTGCTFIGTYEPDGYAVEGSQILKDGKFVGLAIDDMNEDNLTESRIDRWIERIKQETA